MTISTLEPFDKKGRVQMVVETPRGSPIKFKYDDRAEIFTISRTLSQGVVYPFDWGFIPNTMSDDGDPIDALCLHAHASYPGIAPVAALQFLISTSSGQSRGSIIRASFSRRAGRAPKSARPK